MLKRLLCVLALFTVSLCLFSCKKEKISSVKIDIENLCEGGYYYSNIDGVPKNLGVGTNGPFPVQVNKIYTIEYKPDRNFQAVRILWSPTVLPWKIHLYTKRLI
jgi:hypothetical protein